MVIKNYKKWLLVREFLKQYLAEKQNGYFQREVVTYKKWKNLKINFASPHW